MMGVVIVVDVVFAFCSTWYFRRSTDWVTALPVIFHRFQFLVGGVTFYSQVAGQTQ